jgi:hypothetical protein
VVKGHRLGIGVSQGDAPSQGIEKDIVIPPNGQVTAMISELLPQSLKTTGTISGSLEILFDQDVAVAALQFGLGQPLEEPAFQSLSGIVQP